MKRLQMKKILSYLSFLFVLILVVYLAHLWSDTRYQIGSSPIVVTPSPTSYPVLSQDEARAQIIDLLQANGGCRLPCWWGITPGETHWETIHAMLSPMLETQTTADTLLSYGDRLGISTPEEPKLPGFEFHLQDSIVQTITVFSVRGNYLSELDLHHIFQTYGKPDQIYLRGFPFTSRSLVQIFLHYPRQGMAIEYRFDIEAADQKIRVCNIAEPAEADFHLWEYDPPTVQDFYTIATKALWHPAEYKILPLDEASSWTVDLFYEIFERPGMHTACVGTSTDLWAENR
jgi:hypothetical protein